MNTDDFKRLCRHRRTAYALAALLGVSALWLSPPSHAQQGQGSVAAPDYEQRHRPTAEGQGHTTPDAAQNQKVRKEVLLYLSSYHALPEREQFEALSPNVQSLLLEIAQDPSVFSMRRHRAYEALAYWSNEKTWSLYLPVLQKADPDWMHTHRVVQYAARAFPKATLPFLEKYAAHDDLQLRLTAVVALGAMKLPEATSLLHSVKERDPSPIVRDRVVEVLTLR